MTMIPSRRIAFAAAAVILGLTACGDASTNSSGVTAVTPTTTPLEIIRLGAGAGSTAGAPAADSSFATGEKMMAMRLMNFVFDGTLPSLPSTAAAWSFPANPEIDQARIAELATLLGIAGDVRSVPADQGGGWMVGAADYTDANLTVSTDGMASWWFSPSPSVYGGEGVSCPAYDPATSGETGDTVAPCPEPEPPVGVPSADEAEAKAIDLFTSMGYDMANYELEAYADDWSANITAYLMIDGLRTPIALSAGYGANGALTWASGNLADPQPAGEYPLVGPDAGLQRLIDQQGMYGYGAPYMEGDLARSATVPAPLPVGETEGGTVDAPSVDPALPTEIAPPESLPTDGASTDVPADTMVIAPAPGDPVLIDPMPVDTIDTTPITVTLTGVRLDLTMNWDVDGTVWLLPAYAFSDADGGIYTIIAVADEYIQQPEVVDPVPMPAVEPPVADPGSPDGVAPVECPTVVIPTGNTAPGGPLTEEDGTIFAGLCEADAQAVADALGYVLRVVRLDGVDLAATADYVDWRVNVAIDNGVVTEVVSFG